MVIVSPSMPVISEIEVTRRVPSERRATWTTRSMRRGDLLAHGAIGEPHAGHLDHRLQTCQRVARGVGVDRGQTAVVAGVHGLQHVDRFAAAYLADDDAVGTHTQRVANEISLRNFTTAFDIWRPGFQSDDVWLLQLQFGRVFNRDDALVFRNVS